MKSLLSTSNSNSGKVNASSILLSLSLSSSLILYLSPRLFNNLKFPSIQLPCILCEQTGPLLATADSPRIQHGLRPKRSNGVGENWEVLVSNFLPPLFKNKSPIGRYVNAWGVESQNQDPSPPPPPTGQPFVTTICNPQSSVFPFIKRPWYNREESTNNNSSFPHFSLTQNMHQRFLGPLLLALLLISEAPNVLSRPASSLHNENQVFRPSPIDQGALGHANGIGSEKRRVPTGSNPLHNRWCQYYKSSPTHSISLLGL